VTVSAAAFERCMRVGGVAVFPADTVYGLACDPSLPDAVRRLYGLKGRAAAKPAAVMFFDPELALATLPELGERTRALCERLLPGAVTTGTSPASPILSAAAATCSADPWTTGLRS
jgi:L-threonylcarbamoyladenylate synthase